MFVTGAHIPGYREARGRAGLLCQTIMPGSSRHMGSVSRLSSAGFRPVVPSGDQLEIDHAPDAIIHLYGVQFADSIAELEALQQCGS